MTLIRYFDQPRPRFARNAIAVATIIVSIFAPSKAHAWSGCGFGVSASWVSGAVDIPASPINIGADAPSAGGRINCDLKLGAMVIGVFVDDSYAFRDLKTIGVNWDLTAGGRTGILVSASTLVYGHGGWSRVDTDFGHTDGLKLGAGVEFALPHVNGWYMALEYAHGWYDNALGSGLNAHSDAATVRLSYKLWPKVLPMFVDDAAPAAAAPACDKKLANCKK